MAPPKAFPVTVSRWWGDRDTFAFCLLHLKFLISNFPTANVCCFFCEGKKETLFINLNNNYYPLQLTHVTFPGQCMDWPHVIFHWKLSGVSLWFGAPELREAARFSFSFSCLFTMIADDLLVAFCVTNTCHRLQISYTGGRDGGKSTL